MSGTNFVQPVDPATFSTRGICAIRHNFHEHRLMQMPALARLARDLWPSKQCRFIKPGFTMEKPFVHTDEDPLGRDIDEVFRRIEEPGSWIALYNVEKHPDYREFVDEVAACFRPLVEREQGRVFMVNGFIFISAPPSLTPFHIDRENNFWLQVRGRKRMHVWDRNDRQVVPAREVDMFVVWGALENVILPEGGMARCKAFDVGPGDGVYFPSTSPHMTSSDPSWTKPGDGVSVSIGVVFYTEETRRAAYIHTWNLLLRKFGVSPNLPGQSPLMDRFKYPLGRAAVWVKRRLRGYEPQVGF